MGHRFCTNWLLGNEGAKIAVEKQKGPNGVKNPKICYISVIMTLQSPKVGEYSDPIGIIALEKGFIGHRISCRIFSFENLQYLLNSKDFS